VTSASTDGGLMTAQVSSGLHPSLGQPPQDILDGSQCRLFVALSANAEHFTRMVARQLDCPNDRGLFVLPPEMAPVFSQAFDLYPRPPDMTALVQRKGA
jgi:hypothetical protein